MDPKIDDFIQFETLQIEEKILLNTRFEFSNKFNFSQLYENVGNINLRNYFSLIHHFLVEHLEMLNRRLPTGNNTRTFWADNSRALIYLIQSVESMKSNLKGTPLSFSLDGYYQKAFDEMLTWLRDSWGSIIPEHHPKYDVILVRPIFFLEKDDGDQEVFGYSYNRTLIGHGSYAKVFKYKDSFYDKEIAVKRANKDLTEKELERFQREFQTIKSLKSPYIIDVYRYDDNTNEYYMEYIPRTLKTYISENNQKLTTEEKVEICTQIISAFEYIHQKGLLHRDISPTNILVKEYECGIQIKVSDFGLVKIPDSTLTAIDTDFKGVFNDPGLKLEGFDTYSLLHETYALTRILYYVMTGRTNTEKETDPKVKDFLDKGLSVDKRNRYKSISELRTAYVNTFID